MRIDQVWASERFRAVAVRARQTRNSDHHLVICDLASVAHARQQRRARPPWFGRFPGMPDFGAGLPE